MRDDSIDGIYDTLKQCALISKSAGGIGVAVSCIRAPGSYIAGVSDNQNAQSEIKLLQRSFNVCMFKLFRLMAPPTGWFLC